MKELKIVPNGWECTLEECPAGFYVWCDNLCYKTKYRENDGRVQAFNSGGEYVATPDNEIVQPVIYEWVS